jgi:hypothetical protein
MTLGTQAWACALAAMVRAMMAKWGMGVTALCAGVGGGLNAKSCGQIKSTKHRLGKQALI